MGAYGRRRRTGAAGSQLHLPAAQEICGSQIISGIEELEVLDNAVFPCPIFSPRGADMIANVFRAAYNFFLNTLHMQIVSGV